MNLKQSSKHKANETLTSKIHQFLTSNYLTQDKLCVLQIMQEHFMNVKSGNANGIMYTAPILLITGSPSTGKSWLIKTITELAKLMDLGFLVKTAFMGIAALNLDGYTMNSFLDVPLEMNEGNGTSTKVKPWDSDRLQAFKQK